MGGPLVVAARSAASRAEADVLIWAVEKNPNAIVTLKYRKQIESWDNGGHWGRHALLERAAEGGHPRERVARLLWGQRSLAGVPRRRTAVPRHGWRVDPNALHVLVDAGLDDEALERREKLQRPPAFRDCIRCEVPPGLLPHARGQG